MSNINGDIVATAAHKAGNIGAGGTFLAWMADKFSGFTIQDWVTLLVGLAAIASYGTAAYLNWVKAKRINSGGEEK